VETDFAFDQLSPAAFEQLAVALFEQVAGAGIEVYGPGPDGGREATFDGPISWSADDGEDGEKWLGYTVVQAKQCQSPSDSAKNLSWLSGELRDELSKWMTSKTRKRFPRYLLVISNVRLSAPDPAGGIDTLRAELDRRLDQKYGPENSGQTPRQRGLQHIKVWHRDRLNVLVARNASVRQRFTPLIAPGDVLARLHAFLMGEIPDDAVTDVVLDHAQTSLIGERWVRFGEAGEDYHPQSVERVVMDLPAVSGIGSRGTTLPLVLARGDNVLSRSVWHATEAGMKPPPRHLVITGAPGNGKSTLLRYLTQVYRATFAASADQDDARRIIDSTHESMVRLRLTTPLSPRWPLRVDLAALASEMGPGDDDFNLRRHLCDKINKKARIAINLGTLDKWLRIWPSILLLDGLDEVTHPDLRQRILSEIESFVEKADHLDADLLLVVTTRPIGYTPLLTDHFEQIDLAYFTREEARDYGHHVTKEWLASDPDYCQTTLAMFDNAVETTAVERLIKTPLQVLILTVIVARSGLLPANRYELFWTYFDTVFRREAVKPTQYRSFFRNNRVAITDLHTRVGLELHRQCEVTQDQRGRLSLTALRDMARDYYATGMGHDIPAANDLAETLVRVATHRLVLLSADEDDHVSFDLRSLQELMAGCELVRGRDDECFANLRATACNPHWRNAWLFAAGRLFSGGAHDRALVLDVVERCDKDGHWHGWLYPAGPELAADILDDGLAAERPTDRRRLIAVALRVLSGPMPLNPRLHAQRLAAATEYTGRVQDPIAEGLRSDRLSVRAALGSAFDLGDDSVGFAVAANLVADKRFGTDIPKQPAAPEHFVDMWTHQSPLGERVRLGTVLREAVNSYDPLADAPSEKISKALDECDQLELRRLNGGGLRPVSTGAGFVAGDLLDALGDRDSETELQVALEVALPERDWVAASLLARAAWPSLSRRPVGGRLRFDG
jgi:energy-coupling factor transporter ATP-binding protein EcfA2